MPVVSSTQAPSTIISETELIQTFLAPLARSSAGAQNLSDDAACLTPPPGCDLVISTDPIIADVHFFSDDRPDDIAWKALAVNVSDLVAKGAMPLAYTMTLAFPRAPERHWMETFARGLEAAQRAFGCCLIGGDTDRTPGPLAIGITAIGAVPSGRMIRRHSARPGDHIFMTGTLGDSRLGLQLHRAAQTGANGAGAQQPMTDGDIAFLRARYLRPEPRIALVAALRKYATAALDISDGLVKDATRLIGGGGLTMPVSRVPLSPSATRAVQADATLMTSILTGGDDYEVLFAVAPTDVSMLSGEAALAGVKVTDLGVLSDTGGLQIFSNSGQPFRFDETGYDHFGNH